MQSLFPCLSASVLIAASGVCLAAVLAVVVSSWFLVPSLCVFGALDVLGVLPSELVLGLVITELYSHLLEICAGRCLAVASKLAQQLHAKRSRVVVIGNVAGGESRVNLHRELVHLLLHLELGGLLRWSEHRLKRLALLLSKPLYVLLHRLNRVWAVHGLLSFERKFW